MSRKPRLLDLFCGAGGCAKGYQRAGFYVVGVDNHPQPRYCGDEFHQADAMTFPLDGFDVIHASPPCQRYSDLRHLPKRSQRRHPRLIAPMRRSLLKWGGLYVIENVVGSPLRKPLILCGNYFGLMVRRHRLFESNADLSPIADCRDFHIAMPFAVYGDHPERCVRTPGNGGVINRAPTLNVARVAMGIDWMEWKELTQAIPPAYTEYIGRQLIQRLQARVTQSMRA